MNYTEQNNELMRLRNRHVAKILTFFGPDTPHIVVVGVKRSFSYFAEDVAVNILEVEMDAKAQTKELGRLRNRHVAKLLNVLGPDAPEYIIAGLKRSYSFFETDIQTNIFDSANA